MSLFKLSNVRELASQALGRRGRDADRPASGGDAGTCGPDDLAPPVDRIVRAVRPRSTGQSEAAEAKDGAHNRRFAARRVTDSNGLIVSNKLTQPAHCIMRDTSSTGARLELIGHGKAPPMEASEIPDRFTLTFASRTERSEVLCLVMWRRGRQIGVRYTSPFRTTAIKPKSKGKQEAAATPRKAAARTR